MHALRIILLCVAAGVAYGIVHDQITVRVCVEYFSITHPRLIASTSPTLLALAWGVVATWWAGLLLGIPIALAARAGRPPRIAWHAFVRPVLLLLACMAALAVLAGVAGFALASAGGATIPAPVASVVPEAAHHRWVAAWWAHNTSYNVGFVGAIVIVARTLLARRRERQANAAGGA